MTLAATTLLAVACGGGQEAASSGASVSEPADGASASGSAPPAPPSDGDSGTPSEATFPVTISSGGMETTIEQEPSSVISLSPTATEILFAIDAGDQVRAVDDQSNHPSEAPSSNLSGFEPNVEAILAMEPDLVVISNDIEGVAGALGAADVPVLLQPAAETLDDTYTQIEQLGAATGNVGDAAELVGRMQTEIEELVDAAPQVDQTYYHELDSTYFTLTSDTFAGAVYDLFGLRNIADEAGGGSQYPQLSAEAIIEADPDLIFLADTKCCDVTPESVAAREGWGDITAVREGQVIPLDDDVASRWGPRVVEFIRSVSEAVQAAAPSEAPTD